MKTFLIPTISADGWNAMREQAKRNRALLGLGISLQWTPRGVIVTADPLDEFKHPWQMTCRWRADDTIQPLKGQWVSPVRPGFVTGRDVTIHETRVIDRQLVEIDVPLIDPVPPELVLNSFRDPAASGGLAINTEGELVAQPGEGYPEFFATIGVKPASAGGALSGEETDPTRTREIRACDLVLITPRLATRQEVTVSDAVVDSQAVTISTVFATTLPAGHRLRVLPRWSPPREPTALERLLGTAVEPQTDEIRIATVYFVSEPNAGADAIPDQTWTPYPLYFRFWNLAHATREQVPAVPPEPLKLSVPLGLGVGQALINGLLSTVNDAFSQITAYLGAANFSGMYWEPGGTGLDNLNRPKRPKVKPRAGFDPAAVREAEAADAPEPPKLNPPFPFLRTRFDPFFFGLDRDPPEN